MNKKANKPMKTILIAYLAYSLVSNFRTHKILFTNKTIGYIDYHIEQANKAKEAYHDIDRFFSGKIVYYSLHIAKFLKLAFILASLSYLYRL